MSFYDLVSRHNNIISAQTQILTASGRAYKSPKNSFYADKVNVAPSVGATSFEAQKKARPFSSNLYMGNAGLINLKNIASLQPRYAILYDVNIIQSIYWRIILGAVIQNPSLYQFKLFLNYSENKLNSFLTRIFGSIPSLCQDSITAIFDTNPNSLIRKAFTGRIKNLSQSLERLELDEKDYYLFRAMVLERRVGVLTLDLFDKPSWEALVSELSSGFQGQMNPLEIDTLYVSNVYDFSSAHHDWTGLKTKNPDWDAIEQVLSPFDVRIIDDKKNYTLEEFSILNRRKNGWLYQQAMSAESAQENGAVKLAQHLI